jgi:hypothetical protein
MPAKQKGAIYLLRDKFQIYVPGLPSVLEFHFVPQIIRDMDVINQEMFANLIKVFITNSKIPPSDLIIVIADNASFMKDFLSTPPQPPAQPGQPPKPQPSPISPEELDKQVKEFFNFVPFEEIASKAIPLKNGIRAYGTNKDLFETIRRSFEANGFEITSVIPAIAFGPEVNTKPGMDNLMIESILKKADTLVKSYNLLNQPLLTFESEKDKDIKDATGDNGEDSEPLDKPKSQLPLLLGVLGFLLIVLVVVAWFQFGPPSKPKPQPVTPTLPPAAAAAPTAAITLATSPSISSSSGVPSVADTQALTVQIENTAATVGSATTLHDALEKFGFKSVNLSNQTNIGTASTSITFSKNVNATTRSAIINQVQKISPVGSILDKADAATDITIILAK